MTNKDYKPLTTGGYANPKMLPQYRDRLCYLEDCIENGTLLFLPCKVGDTVYYIDTLEEKVQKGKITAIEYWTNGNKEVVAVGCKGTRSLYFGKTVFKTKVVAERTLEEYKEKWRENERTDKEQRKS